MKHPKLKKIKFKKPAFRLKTWQLALVLFPLLFFSATLLRLDHIHMSELRSAVLRADELGDDEALSSSLLELRNYVSSHIIINVVDSNGEKKIVFGTGPFYLEHSYRIAAESAIEDAESRLTSGDNQYGNIYLLASNICKEQAAGKGWSWTSEAYISCMTSEIEKYPSSSDIIDSLVADIPSTELYRRDFSSPVWTFSLSGVSILFCLLLIVVIFTKFFIWILFRLSLLIFKS